MSEISQTISGYVLETFFSGDESDFNQDTPLLSSGVVDSISALELVAFLEDTFSLEFKPHEVDRDNLDTVSRMTQFVVKKQG